MKILLQIGRRSHQRKEEKSLRDTLYIHAKVDFMESSDVVSKLWKSERGNRRSKGNKVDWLGNVGSDSKADTASEEKEGQDQTCEVDSNFRRKRDYACLWHDDDRGPRSRGESRRARRQ